MKEKRGFTIVELLMVIGIISVLLTIATTVASSSIKSSRKQRANALCMLVQTGLATYYAQEGEWPVDICNNPRTRENKEGDDGKTDPDKIVLKADEVKTAVLKLVEKTKDNKPMMDISGLFVSKSQGRFGEKAFGLDFMSAVRGTRESSEKLKSNKMYFGYPEENHGYFRHFKMVYSIPADTISVMTMDTDKAKADFYE